MKNCERITSRDNARLMAARRVREGREAGVFIEGVRLAREALQAGLRIRQCFVGDDLRDKELAELAAERSEHCALISDKLMRSIADTAGPQGIIIIADQPSGSRDGIEARLSTAALPLVVFLNEVNNPANLGAVLRSCDAAGAAGVITSQGSAAAFSPKAMRAAMGASFRVPVWSGASWEEVLRWAGERGLRTIAADAKGTQPYASAKWTEPSLLVFGSEAHGLSDEQLEAIDLAVNIPMESGAESLNLAVAAGVVLFEARRQVLSTG